jgi:hypothetical protein
MKGPEEESLHVWAIENLQNKYKDIIRNLKKKLQVMKQESDKFLRHIYGFYKQWCFG